MSTFNVMSFYRTADGRDHASQPVTVHDLDGALRLWRRMQEQPRNYVPDDAVLFVVGPVYEERDRRLPALVRPSAEVTLTPVPSGAPL